MGLMEMWQEPEFTENLELPTLSFIKDWPNNLGFSEKKKIH